jgi:hypothetical protein
MSVPSTAAAEAAPAAAGAGAAPGTPVLVELMIRDTRSPFSNSTICTNSAVDNDPIISIIS